MIIHLQSAAWTYWFHNYVDLKHWSNIKSKHCLYTSKHCMSILRGFYKVGMLLSSMYTRKASEGDKA